MIVVISGGKWEVVVVGVETALMEAVINLLTETMLVAVVMVARAGIEVVTAYVVVAIQHPWQYHRLHATSICVILIGTLY